MSDAALFDALSDRVMAGELLTMDDVAALVDTRDVVRLGALADERRRRRRGDRVTFVRVLELPLTESDLGAGASGAGEIRVTGRPETASMALGALERTVEAARQTPVTGFALDHLVDCCAGDAARFDRLVAALAGAGLAAISEAVVERTDRPDWIGRARDAGLPIARLTVHDPAVSGLDLIRRVAGWGGGAPAQAFAPLPRRVAAKPTTGYEDVRQVAFSRLLVDNIDSIQVDWLLHGPRLAQVALAFGADDVDGVSPIDNPEEGARRMPEVEIRRQIRAVGLDPVERDGRFVVRLTDEQ